MTTLEDVIGTLRSHVATKEWVEAMEVAGRVSGEAQRRLLFSYVRDQMMHAEAPGSGELGWVCHVRDGAPLVFYNGIEIGGVRAMHVHHSDWEPCVIELEPSRFKVYKGEHALVRDRRAVEPHWPELTLNNYEVLTDDEFRSDGDSV